MSVYAHSVVILASALALALGAACASGAIGAPVEEVDGGAQPSQQNNDERDAGGAEGSVNNGVLVSCVADQVELCETSCGSMGVQRCVGSKLGACEPPAEDCNGLDDDCDANIDEGLQTRGCSSACGGGDERCQGGRWSGCSAVSPEPESCNNLDDDCDSQTDEALVRSCESACGPGDETCLGGEWVGCSAPDPEVELCNNQDDDCDGDTDEGLTRGCSTACGEGSERCAAGRWASCDAPAPSAESCNLQDDDCDGSCDEGPIAGCRVGVHRGDGNGHVYSTDLAFVSSAPYHLETANYFYLLSNALPGTGAVYLCRKPSGKRFVTDSSSCEIGVTPERTLGYWAGGASCGAVPLYRLYHDVTNDHFYTTSSTERDRARDNLGYRFESVVGYVWSSP